MTKQFVSIVELPVLYDILNEVNHLFLFEVFNFINTENFVKKNINENPNVLNSIVVSRSNNKKILSQNINTNRLIFLNDDPINLSQFLDKVNILLIKKKYNFQSQLNINNYTLNLNSRIISFKDYNLKLTEREVDIILFLNETKNPQSINNLQNEVWKYSSALETHTVETHIYRLRKKILNTFNDNEFIVSRKNGYQIK